MHNSFRPIHYMGNKFQYLEVIAAAVAELNPSRGKVLDPFAGTGVVARRLAVDQPVISSDIQSYSAILTRAQTQPEKYNSITLNDLRVVYTELLSEARSLMPDLLRLDATSTNQTTGDATTLLANIVEDGSLAMDLNSTSALARAKQEARTKLSRDAFPITWYYGGVYFSYLQALSLDCISSSIQCIINHDERDTAYAALMGVASDIVSTVGNHFAQPIRPRDRSGSLKVGWMPTVVARRSVDVYARFSYWIGKYSALDSVPHPHSARTMDFRDAISEESENCRVVYADPPYTRDHYSRFYHVLETIALGDDPGLTLRPGTRMPSRGLYRQERHQSPFSIRSEAERAFDALLAGVAKADASVVLSYSPMGSGTVARPETRTVGIESLHSLAKRHFKDVEIVDVERSRHSRFNRATLNGDVPANAEILLICAN